MQGRQRKPPIRHPVQSVPAPKPFANHMSFSLVLPQTGLVQSESTLFWTIVITSPRGLQTLPYQLILYSDSNWNCIKCINALSSTQSQTQSRHALLLNFQMCMGWRVNSLAWATEVFISWPNLSTRLISFLLTTSQNDGPQFSFYRANYGLF